MNIEVTARSNDLIRLEGDGIKGTLRIVKKSAHLLQLYQENESLIKEDFSNFLEAVESEAAKAGAIDLIYQFSEDPNTCELFSDLGFEVKAAGEMLSFNAGELLNSEAVKKALRMKSPGIVTAVLENLMTLQMEDIIAFLKKNRFEIPEDDLFRFDLELSFAAYDEDYNPRAVLLTTKCEGGHLIDLLLGFSKTKPQYMLCVLQKFATSLYELVQKEGSEKIFVYSCTEFVRPLLLRFLDKKYELKKEYSVYRAVKKKITDKGEVKHNLMPEDPLELFKEEADKVLGLRNIGDKTVWLSR